MPPLLPVTAGARVTLLAILLALAPASLEAQDGLSPEHRQIDFLVGEWRTVSEFPDGEVREGDLSYRWVLGGSWMKVEFVGEAPAGQVWEAHVMQRWDEENGEYEAWSFPPGGDPVRSTGSSPEAGRYTTQRTSEAGVTSGIDYRANDDGTVYQENWVIEDGERRVTLRTDYRPAEGG